MINKDYMWAGIAAIAAMILFPVYYIYAASIGWDNPTEEFLRSEMALTVNDWIFLGLGMLQIYIYYSLMHILHAHHNFRGVDIVLYMIMITLTLLHGGLFLMDAAATLMGSSLSASVLDLMINAGMALFGGSILVFGILDLLMGIILLRNRKKLSGLVFGFGLVCLLMAPFEMSVIFSFITILAFPVALALLAVVFLRKPAEIEVV